MQWIVIALHKEECSTLSKSMAQTGGGNCACGHMYDVYMY